MRQDGTSAVSKDITNPCVGLTKKLINKISAEEEEAFLGVVHSNLNNTWITRLNVNNRIIFKIDMGANVTVIPMSLFSILKPFFLQFLES